MIKIGDVLVVAHESGHANSVARRFLGQEGPVLEIDDLDRPRVWCRLSLPDGIDYYWFLAEEIAIPVQARLF